MVSFPATAPVEVRSDEDVRELSVYLMRFERPRIVVVVTTDQDGGEPLIDPEALFRDYAGKGEGIDVAVIRSMRNTHRLSDRISQRLSVYQGAVRIYPKDGAWQEPGNYRLSPLCLPPRDLTRFDRSVRDAIDVELRRAERMQEDRDRAGRSASPTWDSGRSAASDASPAAVGASVDADLSASRSSQSGQGPKGRPSIRQSAQLVSSTQTSSPQTSSTQTSSTQTLSTQTSAAQTSSASPTVPAGLDCDYDGLSGTVIAVASDDEAERLAAYLTSPDRTRPAVVVSRRFGKALFNAELIARKLTDVAKVFELTTPQSSWGLSGAMPPGTKVYNGSARLYPIGIDWVDDPSELRYYIGWSEAELKTLTYTLIDNAVGMVARSYSSTVTTQRPQIVQGRIGAVYDGRGIAMIDDGDMASVVLPEAYERYGYGHVLRKGQLIRGMYDPQSHTVVVTPDRQDARQALAAYDSGQTVLARVDKVTAAQCVVELFPGVSIRMGTEDETGITDMRDLASAGMVLPIYIAVKGTVDADGDYQHDWLLSITDADVDQVRPAPSLLVSGPPWLDPSDMETRRIPDRSAGDTAMLGAQFDSVQAMADFLTGPDGRIDVSAADDVFQYLTQLQHEMQQLRDSEKTASDRVEGMKAKMRQKQRENAYNGSQYKSLVPLFADADEGRRFEREQMDMMVRRAWAIRLGPAEKKDHPLPRKWGYSDWFFDTLAATRINVGKVVDVMVEVLIGRDIQLAGRQNHRLRTGPGGDDPYRLGPNGETCFRDSLQVGQAAARRLHYMRSADNTVTFTSVRNHDDFAL
ncbi:hypothetical protein [Bifidobacterium leontopitheci]|uniref:Nicotinate phosphoribosyltransferase n=1 Tax=Bifidobacterium leontopitheci TaxID=2650774 RepID=A0A6I1GFJ4_9BIFI|nr:hypothetical protein [Bifidobacterium leontopitheci]KAB7790420.1 nicotinate phosphoribosyltransferase [Bifidobacterium leontopitheci]